MYAKEKNSVELPGFRFTINIFNTDCSIGSNGVHTYGKNFHERKNRNY